MMEEHSVEYLKYQESAPFMMPIPRAFSHIIAFPFRTDSDKKGFSAKHQRHRLRIRDILRHTDRTLNINSEIEHTFKVECL
jgi:hypothetical protein